MTYQRYCVVSAVLFAFVALAHLLRILYNMPVIIDTYDVPMAVSWFGVALPAALAFRAIRIMRA